MRKQIIFISGITLLAVVVMWPYGSKSDAAAVLLLTAVYERTTARYGERGIRYVHIEIGHVGQNVCLQAVALKLGAVVIGAFDDPQVKRIANLMPKEEPLYLIAIGRK